MTEVANLWALIIGIDDYQAVPKLRGCVADAEAVADFLQRNMNVPDDNIRILTDANANRAAIIQAFQDLSTDSRIKKDDQILIHYSGHGSQMKDFLGIEPDGLNETLVAWDSRLPGIPDIPDKVTAALLDKLVKAKGENITIFFDCCHSGGGTRKADTDADGPRARQAPADGAPPALPQSDLDLIAGWQAGNAGPSGWVDRGIKYTLLAACRDEELANEYRAQDDEGNTSWHGAFTYFLLQALRKMGPNTSYAQIYDQVAVQINSRYKTQMPQCEGNRDREVFGNRPVERDPFIRVRTSGGDIALEAGLIHNLQVGTKLEVYPLDVNTRAEAEEQEPLATIEVMSATATKAKAKIVNRDSDIPEASHAIITENAYAGQRQTLALESKGGAVNDQAITDLKALIDESATDGGDPPYLDVLADPKSPADLRVIAENGVLSIYNRNGDELIVPEDIEDGGASAEAVLNSLQSIARFRNITELANEDNGSRLQGKITVALEHLQNGEAHPLKEGSVGDGGEITLTYDPENEDSNYYSVKITNGSRENVFPYVFLLGADYSISLFYPQSGQQDVLPAGDTFNIGLAQDQDPLEIYLPEVDDLYDGSAQWDYSRDYIKVITTTSQTDFDVLQQDGLNVPPPSGGTRSVGSALDSLIDTVAGGTGTRLARRKKRDSGEDWATAELTYAVVRANGKQDLSSRGVDLGDGLSIQAPDGVGGTVQITTVGQAKRSADGDPDIAPPPTFEAIGDQLQPVSRAGTRGVGSNGLVVAFDVDEQSRKKVTKDNPIKIGVPTEPNEQSEVIPVAFDGEIYLPVGFSDDSGSVDIVNLPEQTGGASTRGLGRTVKLFLYKKLKRQTDLTGLRYVQLNRDAQGKIVDSEYIPIDKSQFKKGDRVALFVHGFSADTKVFKAILPPFLEREGIQYDHYIAWDYETYGTSVEDTAMSLATALKEKCGFSSDDEIGLDIYAHSMGTLVTRTVIELMGGNEFVDRAILAGPPNEGSKLANVVRGGVFLTTFILNQVSLVPIVAGLNWGLKQMYEQNLGGKDLEAGSKLVEKLNSLTKPDNTDYLVLAGKNKDDGKLQNIALKVLDKGLDTLFGEDNDVAIGLSSLRGVRKETYPKLQINEFECDHFSYWALPEAQETIKTWLTR